MPDADPKTETNERPLAAVILAAGKGTRMRSDRPKVVHEVADRAMVCWVVDACRAAGAAPIALVIGHGADEVRAAFAGDDADVAWAIQDEQLGTGHATLCAKDALGDFEGDVLVLAGDGPLLRAETVIALRDRHRSTGAVATLASSVIDDPTGYGRVIREADGSFRAIVEQKNAAPEELAVREVYPSYACFDARALFAELERLPRDETSGEYYVTDLFRILKDSGRRVEVIDAVPPEDILSINTPEQLAEVDAILRARLEAAGIAAGEART